MKYRNRSCCNPPPSLATCSDGDTSSLPAFGGRGGGIIAVLSLLIAGIAAQPALAAPTDDLRQVEEQMSQKKQQQDALNSAAQQASKGLNGLRQKLISSTQRLQEKEAEGSSLDDRLDELTQQIADKSKASAQERAQLSLMVSALVEIASRPPESLFLQDHVTADHIHRSLLLKAILPRLREQAENGARNLSALYEMQTQLASQQKLVAAAHENLERQQQDLDQLIAVRQGFLQRTEVQKAEIAQHLAALSAEARNLRQLMEKVAPQRVQKNKVKPSGDKFALRWPVSGTVMRHFGDKDADGVTSDGLTFASPSAAPIVAPRAGRVVFAGPFRGYGKIVIIQHANGYHSLLSGFGRIDAEMSQDVDAGEPLGVLPVKAGAKQELYFEWRHGDQPIDPLSGFSLKR